jgi:hypothetical protein
MLLSATYILKEAKIMIGSILSKLGGSLGGALGGGILSTIGRYAGKLAGDYLEKKWFQRNKTTHKFTNAHDSFHIAMAKYGTPIPLTFGRTQLDGQIIWADKIFEKRNSSSVKKYIKGSNLNLTKETTELEYFLSFAVCICIGKIEDIERVWLGEETIDISKYNFKLYKGDEEQLPDPTIAAKTGKLTPAYRGLAYIVFKDLPLAEFNDTIPNFTFEVLRKANVETKASVEELVESIIMIPGSGEFVYDTQVQSKFRLSENGVRVNSRKINSHNHYNLPNSIHSLNQLKSTCSNVKWVSPVVCWFGNDVSAKDCIIRPAVEFKDTNVLYSEDWQVAGYNRQNAYEITKDKNGNPTYGGSVNDASVVRYLSELRNRKLNIMFYPMFFLDVPGKPWRGRVTGAPEHIANFFNRKNGYNEYILHYASLVKDHVDAFVIGSELIGLTTVQNNGTFPAVDELVKLAAKVKQIVGTKVKVTYAADWSEYHHTEGGWFNLDPIWSSNDIDFIGIDAYFPITDSTQSNISKEDIEKGFYSGEGYDYYIDSVDNSRKALDPKYAWKNLRYWWENQHKNPDGNFTNWKPKSKPIWFTEYGFPSIDKATNQPNVFFDDKCIDGGVPKNSNGQTNFQIQRTAIKAFIEYWRTQEYIGEMFLWCWDARPYPAWPVANIWNDGYLWEKGHWVNYKFGSSNLASILLEISKRCGLDIDSIDVSSVDEKIEGLIFSNNISALNAINTLRAAYFFDINAQYKNIITFQKRGADKKIQIVNEQIMKLADNSHFEIVRTSEESKINLVNIYYINYNDTYNTHHEQLCYGSSSYQRDVIINLPIILTPSEASNIGKSILQNAHNETEAVRFVVCDQKMTIKPSSFIRVDIGGKSYIVRVIDISFANNQSIITAIIDHQDNYNFPASENNSSPATIESFYDDKLVICDLPFHISNSSGSYLAVYFQGKNDAALYSNFPNRLEYNWGYVTNIKPNCAIGEIIDFKQSIEANIFMVDSNSKLIICGHGLEQYISSDWQYAQIGEEIIKFKNIQEIEPGIYEVSELIRGLFGTEEFIPEKRDGKNFILLEANPNIIRVSENLKNQKIAFKANDLEQTLDFNDKSQNDLPPYIISRLVTNNNLHIVWIQRTNHTSSWEQSSTTPQKTYQVTLISDGTSHKFISNSYEINIDVTNLSLSDDFKIHIMTQIKLGGNNEN